MLLLVALLIGCRKNAAAPARDGAKEIVQTFYEALLQRDWPTAYAKLDMESRARVPMDQFDRLARQYAAGLGFEPTAVQIRHWDEQGDEATASVVLIGQAGDKTHRYKDGITLNRRDDGWRSRAPRKFRPAGGTVICLSLPRSQCVETRVANIRIATRRINEDNTYSSSSSAIFALLTICCCTLPGTMS